MSSVWLDYYSFIKTLPHNMLYMVVMVIYTYLCFTELHTFY